MAKLLRLNYYITIEYLCNAALEVNVYNLYRRTDRALRNIDNNIVMVLCYAALKKKPYTTDVLLCRPVAKRT